MAERAEFTAVEEWIDQRVHHAIDTRGSTKARRFTIELLAFAAKQAWACVFGALLLVVIVVLRLWYPSGLALSQSDAITLAAVAIQIGMVATRLETLRELWVIVLFHIVGTIMELFKTDVGSWTYDFDGVLHIGAVPLYSGFMYGAVGSYMVRVFRMFDLRFTRYPPIWLTTVLAAAIYANFFTHHFWWDARWLLLVAVAVLWLRTTMHFRVFRRTLRLPLLVAFAGVALFIWIAENIGTGVGAWAYPSQADGWEPVSGQKIVSWFLLMIISVVLVTWVYRPRPPEVAAS